MSTAETPGGLRRLLEGVDPERCDYLGWFDFSYMELLPHSPIAFAMTRAGFKGIGWPWFSRAMSRFLRRHGVSPRAAQVFQERWQRSPNLYPGRSKGEVMRRIVAQIEQLGY